MSHDAYLLLIMTLSALCQISLNYATYSSLRQIPGCTNVPEIYSCHVFEEIWFDLVSFFGKYRVIMHVLLYVECKPRLI